MVTTLRPSQFYSFELDACDITKITQSCDS